SRTRDQIAWSSPIARKWHLGSDTRSNLPMARLINAEGANLFRGAALPAKQAAPTLQTQNGNQIRRRARLLRRALRQDPLQGTPVHVETARGLRHVAPAQLVDALDVLPAHAIGRHWILRRLDLAAVEREQRGYDIVGVDRLGEIIDRAELHRVHR